MRASNKTRKRSDYYFRFSTTPFLHKFILKTPKFPSINQYPNRHTHTKNPVWTTYLHPESTNSLPREVNSPCSVPKLGLSKCRKRAFLRVKFSGIVKGKGKRGYTMGNAFSYCFGIGKAKKRTAVGSRKGVKKYDEVIDLDAKEAAGLNGGYDDSSIEKIEVLAYGDEGRSTGSNERSVESNWAIIDVEELDSKNVGKSSLYSPISPGVTKSANRHKKVEDRSSGELRALDCNLTSLCDHIQVEGFNSGSFSDIVVNAMGSTYCLHRLIISRSSYFRNMLLGPWKESNATFVTLHVDDNNVNGEAIAMALSYLYGHHPKLNDNNAFRVLAAASFLDLQDLCVICTDFIISELWTSNFLAYQVFAENQDYGMHGERVRNACWGYLCQSGFLELKEVLPKLSSQTLYALLTSDELWVPAEETRFELAFYTLIKKGALCKLEHPERGSPGAEVGTSTHFDSSKFKAATDTSVNTKLESELKHLGFKDDQESHSTAHNVLVELADCVVDFHTGAPSSKQQAQQEACSQLNLAPRCPCGKEPPSSSKTFLDRDGLQSTCGFVEMPIGIEVSSMGSSGMPMEGPSEEVSCYHMNDNS